MPFPHEASRAPLDLSLYIGASTLQGDSRRRARSGTQIDNSWAFWRMGRRQTLEVGRSTRGTAAQDESLISEFGTWIRGDLQRDQDSRRAAHFAVQL